MLEILGVDRGSIAAEMAIEAGDRLLAINGQPVRDLIDYLVAAEGGEILLEIERKNGELWDLELEYDPGDNLGLLLPHPQPEQCGNNCLFCFVHQLPKGLRRSLYVKDEDYRFSYLYGSYVTLTNLDQAAVERILAQHLSPLYVSVHATDDQLRQRLLGRQSPSILELLRTLVAGGIELHTQIVICPGINDGVALEQTCHDLLDLAPGVLSLALVPVGLTGYRRHLPELRTVTRDEARALIAWVQRQQADCLARFGRRLIFAADELYLKADADFPPLANYEDLPQIENGVGLIPLFRHQAAEVLVQVRPLCLPPVSLVTGRSAAGELQRFIDELTERCGIDLRLFVIDNRFFAGEVTVTGLLTGQDLLEQLADQNLGRILLLPDVLLRDGEDLLLDDLRIVDLAERLGVEIEIVASDPWGLWDMLEAIEAEGQG
ncbi:MAG: DUF512 domain-containing protein [Desulfuromonadales bacterium]|nr:DUF512 domain-containing protein [Desulfuromonadales bacterium]